MFISYMGWLQLVGSVKLQVSFAKEPCKRDEYSAKETYNLKQLTNRRHLIVSLVASLLFSTCQLVAKVTMGWLQLVGCFKL